MESEHYYLAHVIVDIFIPAELVENEGEAQNIVSNRRAELKCHSYCEQHEGPHRVFVENRAPGQLAQYLYEPAEHENEDRARNEIRNDPQYVLES